MLDFNVKKGFWGMNTKVKDAHYHLRAYAPKLGLEITGETLVSEALEAIKKAFKDETFLPYDARLAVRILDNTNERPLAEGDVLLSQFESGNQGGLTVVGVVKHKIYHQYSYQRVTRMCADEPLWYTNLSYIKSMSRRWPVTWRGGMNTLQIGSAWDVHLSPAGRVQIRLPL